MDNIISNLGILPKTNMLSLNSYPLCPDDAKLFNAITWQGVFAQLARTFQNNSKDPEKWHKSFGDLVYMRGSEVYKDHDFSVLQEIGL